MPEAKKMIRVIFRLSILLRVILRNLFVGVTYPMSSTLLTVLAVPYPAITDVFHGVASLHRNGWREATAGNTSLCPQVSCSQAA